MKKGLLLLCLVLLSTVIVYAGEEESSPAASSTFCIGWTPTDLFVPAYFQGFISLQGEILLASGSALTIPVGFASAMGINMFMFGIGYRFYPASTQMDGFYLGLNAGLIIASSFISITLPFADINIGYKISLKPIFIEPELGYGISFSPSFSPIGGKYIIGLRIGAML